MSHNCFYCDKNQCDCDDLREWVPRDRVVRCDGCQREDCRQYQEHPPQYDPDSDPDAEPLPEERD